MIPWLCNWVVAVGLIYLAGEYLKCIRDIFAIFTSSTRRIASSVHHLFIAVERSHYSIICNAT
jgi:hypothetical protein